MDDWKKITKRNNRKMYPACDVAMGYLLTKINPKIIKENKKFFHHNPRNPSVSKHIKNLISCHYLRTCDQMEDFTNYLEENNYFL